MGAPISIEQLYFSHIMGELFFSTGLNEFMDYLSRDNIHQLFSLHRQSLAAKTILTPEALLKAIRIDFEKILFALLEVRNKTCPQLLHDFFGSDTQAVLDILPALKERSIYHLGFEVNQPMDLILYSFDYWINKFNAHFSATQERLRAVKRQRFPASREFQRRVKAYVEILRIWIELDGQVQMLELFDIHHGAAVTLDRYEADGLRMQNARPQSLAETRTDYQGAVARLLAGDAIWHYAVYVDQPEEVARLHSHFQALSGRDSAYELPFSALVNNTHDGSLYTKIINRARNMELEFVTELALPAPAGTGVGVG